MYSLQQLKTENGIIRTKSLFYELSYDSPEYALFTLKEEDIVMPDGRPATALGKLYIAFATMDPTEYQFATAVFGSWEVWEKMQTTVPLKKPIEKWRREAEVKRKSLAFESVVKEIQEGGRSSFTAAKFLINEEWKATAKAKEDGRAARKEKNLKDKTTSEEAFERAGVNEDLKRLKDQGLIN
jgi:hypothetical protein